MLIFHHSQYSRYFGSGVCSLAATQLWRSDY